MLRHRHADNKIPQYRCLPGLRESLKANKVSGVEVQKEKQREGIPRQTGEGGTGGKLGRRRWKVLHQHRPVGRNRKVSD